MDTESSAAETTADKTLRAHNWFNEHLLSTFQAMNNFESDSALADLGKARRELAESNLGAELIAMLIIRLRYVEFQIRRLTCDAAEFLQLRGELLEFLAQPEANQLAAAVRSSYLIQLRTQMLRDEGVAYPVAEFHAHYDQIPAELYTSELDLYIACWAYLAKDQEVLAKVFGEYTLNPGHYQARFVWQVINFMYQLLTEKAAVRDVLEMIKALGHPRHWHFLEKTAWPEVVELGLVTPEVAAALAERIAKLQPQDETTTRPEKRTRHMITD
ncbi:hypothetical protein JW859_09185 [bacterium]|nr:hypothetical protein [bacterium]